MAEHLGSVEPFPMPKLLSFRAKNDVLSMKTIPGICSALFSAKQEFDTASSP